MRDYSQQVKKALAAYLSRGELVVKAFDKGDVDEATKHLRDREAAYHNFRAADGLALDRGYDVSKDEQMVMIYRHIAQVDRSIAERIKEVCSELAKDIISTRKQRSIIAKYKSGNQTVSSRILGSV